ncbi:hypothetical protein [Deinococcus sp. QL22]|uniref:hypothetical protein n=1 Tax=Deinococcus sp. QL22 TaxID=2939437 RepID=UPI002017953A|nr:hypothetical protein [Deinococcus sp. QL22]UQN10703.1 hypothetical protein M1R55_30495 [Deinococcus sp. QL22]
MTRFTEQGWRDFQILFPASNGFLGHDDGLDRDRVEQTELHTLGHPPTRCILSISIHEEPHETLVVLSSPQGHGQDLHLWGPDPLDFRTPSPALHAPTGIQVDVLQRVRLIQKQDAWGHLAARLTGEEKTGVLHEHFTDQLVAQGWTLDQMSVSEALCSSAWHLTDAVSDVQAVLFLLRLGERDWLARFESARLVETGTVGMSMYG